MYKADNGDASGPRSDTFQGDGEAESREHERAVLHIS